MRQSFQRTPAQIQADPGGTFFISSIAAGIALLKDSRDIFGGNADSCVCNHQGLFCLFIHIDCHASPFRILDRIGQNLFQNKFQPFFIRQHLTVHRLIHQREFFPDKQRRIFFNRLANDIVKALPLQHQIVGFTSKPQILEDHQHILFNLEKF